MHKFIPSFLATVLLSTTALAQSTSSKPVMLMPPSFNHNFAFKELFEHPDQWQQTRTKIYSVGVADWILNRDDSDSELDTTFSMLKQWNLKLSLEVGAIKEWGVTGDAAFAHDNAFWKRFVAHGGSIDIIGMDEPLCACRFFLHEPDDYAVENTADFIAAVRQNYPNAKIGDIEPYPGISESDLVKWIDALQAKLKEKGVAGIDFFRLDIDWMHFVLENKGSYREVKKLEMACRARHIPFSLVYWSANWDDAVRRGVGDDSTWYTTMMQMGYDYKAVNGAPDEYVIESWVNGPSHSVPESDQWTFTRSALDFCNKFVK
jgi:hypothetical protein